MNSAGPALVVMDPLIVPVGVDMDSDRDMLVLMLTPAVLDSFIPGILAAIVLAGIETGVEVVMGMPLVSEEAPAIGGASMETPTEEQSC